MSQDSEFDNKFEERLHKTTFGGVFGEGWEGLKAPRLYFYPVAIGFAFQWLAITIAMIILLQVTYPVIIASIIMLAWYVIRTLTWQRGQDEGLVQETVSAFIDLLVVWPLLEIGLVLVKRLRS